MEPEQNGFARIIWVNFIFNILVPFKAREMLNMNLVWMTWKELQGMSKMKVWDIKNSQTVLLDIKDNPL